MRIVASFEKRLHYQACHWLLGFRELVASSQWGSISYICTRPSVQALISCCLDGSAVAWMLSLFSCLFLHAGTRAGLHDIPPQTSVIPCCLESSISAFSWNTRPSLVWPWPDLQPHFLLGSPSQSIHMDCSSSPTHILFFCLSLFWCMLVPQLVMSFSLLCLSTSFSKVSANGISLQKSFPVS